MAKSWPLSTKVRTEDIPSKVIFTDTETKTEDDGTMRLVLGCYEVWQVDSKGLPRYQTDTGTYHDEGAFYALVKRNLDCRVIAHNWAFDAAVLRLGARDNLLEHGYDIDLSRGIYPAGGQGYAPFLVTLQFDEGFAEFVCNTNYYKTSLAKIGDSLKVPKMEMPNAEDTSALEAYCQNDVLILRMAYFSLFVFTEEVGNTTPGITAAMAANRVFRHSYYTKKKRVQGTLHIPFINQAERAAYHGGRTDTFYKGVPTADTIYKYDVNSLYPSCMVQDVPVRYAQVGKREPDWVSRMITSGEYIVLAKAEIYIPPESRYGFLGLEGVVHEGQLLFPVGRYTAWMWQPLLEIALEQGYVESLSHVLLYDAEDIFSDYIHTMFRQRQQYKADGNGSFDTLTKLLMNSLYGKFAQRVNEDWAEVGPDSNEYSVMVRENPDGMLRWNDMYELGTTREYWQIGERLYGMTPSEHRELSPASVCSIAGYITAQGRATLYRALCVILDSGGEIYMVDTDSIVSDRRLPDSMVSETQLGKWKLEMEVPGPECCFYAPKHYFMHGKLTLKGIRKPVEGQNVYTQEVFPNFMVDLLSTSDRRRERLETGAVIRSVVKTVSGRNTKRIEHGDRLPTSPFILDT